MVNCQTVHFVYLGKFLPPYAKASLDLAHKYSGMRVHLIGNKTIGDSLNCSPCDFTAVEDFYSDDLFSVARLKIDSDQRYRDGFWAKTMERFFVLYEFAKYKGLDSIFHAELDQLLFGVSELVNNIERQQLSGIFVPFHSPDAAVASVLYCNSLDVFHSLLVDAMTGDPYPSEMALIAKWASRNSNSVIALPTAASLVKGRNAATPKGVFEIMPHELGGVVDAAQLGQWIAGIDPRNVPLSALPRNKFVDAPADNLLSRNELESIKFRYVSNADTVLLDFNNGETVRIFNLHIHAKIHQAIASGRLHFDDLLRQTNSVHRLIVKASIRPWLLNHAIHYTRTILTRPDKIIPAVLRLAKHLIRIGIKKS